MIRLRTPVIMLMLAAAPACRRSPEPVQQATVPDSIHHLIVRLHQQLGAIREWKVTATAALRADSATPRADSIAWRQRVALIREMRPIAAAYYEHYFDRLPWPPVAPLEALGARSFSELFARHGVIAERAEGNTYLAMDADSLRAWLAPYVTAQLSEFLEFDVREQQRPFASDASMMITYDEVTERIVRLEELMNAYPQSPARPTTEYYYRRYLTAYLGGTDNTPAFDWKTKLLHAELRANYHKFLAEHGNTQAARELRDYLELLKRNGYRQTEEVLEYLRVRWRALIPPRE
jgi:hypothetical protein